MSSLCKMIAREMVVRTPVLRNLFFDFEFSRRIESFRGVYHSFPEATAHIPAKKLAGYDHAEIATINEPRLEVLNSGDYPVLFWLARILPEARGVFDLGGNLGVAFYTYRRFLSISKRLNWTVCEVPHTALFGRTVAQRRGETQLLFTDRHDDAPEADILFTAGALQYIEETLPQILAKRETQPRHIIVQRVPLQEGDSFITLQSNGSWVVPYKVENAKEFITGIESQGYELVDRWNTWRSLQLLAYPQKDVARYQGMYFRLKGIGEQVPVATFDGGNVGRSEQTPTLSGRLR